MHQLQKLMQGTFDVIIEEHELKLQTGKEIHCVLLASVQSFLTLNGHAAATADLNYIEFRNSQLKCGFLERVQGPGGDHRFNSFHLELHLCDFALLGLMTFSLNQQDYAVNRNN